MPKFDSQASYPYPMSVVFNAVVQALQNLRGWVVKEVNQPYWYAAASVSFNFWSYGEDIAIQVTESPPGQSWIGVSSVSKFALIDFGKNRKNVENLFAEVQNVLAQTGYAAGYQQQEQQAPAAVQCLGCGAPQPPDAMFCSGCGQEITRPQTSGVVTEQPAQAPAAAECPACGTEQAPDAKFCAGCGKVLRPPDSSG